MRSSQNSLYFDRFLQDENAQATLFGECTEASIIGYLFTFTMSLRGVAKKIVAAIR